MVRVCICFGLIGQAGTGVFHAFLLLQRGACGRALRAAHGQHVPVLHHCKGRLRTGKPWRAVGGTQRELLVQVFAPISSLTLLPLPS